MFGGRKHHLAAHTYVQMLILGQSTSWSYPTTTAQYTFAIGMNNEVFFGGHSNIMYQWNKTSLSGTQMKDLGYTRYGYSQLRSLVSLDSGIEKWCLSNISDNCKTKKIDI